MKQLRHLLLFIPLILGIVSCSTDDLSKDIDNLKDRVANLEAQVLLLNENVNALRTFVEGNKTISSYEKTADGYKIVLSDGQEIELTQGQPGEVRIPDISINDDGFWVINGVTQDGKNAIGNNAPAPKFAIDAEGYWTVDLGEGPQRVLGADGQPVKATTDGDMQVGDTFFSAVEVVNGEMVVTMNDGKTYALPIVEGLKCNIITDGVVGFNNGILSMGEGQTVSLNVEISEATYILNAPAGWTVSLSEPVDGNATLTIIAPGESAANSRATADNTKDVVLQVNKGVNWAVDKIQVEVIKVVSSYYELYQAGETLELVSGVNINKATYGEAVLVNSADHEFSKDNVVYFIEPSVTVNWTSTLNFENLILIGNSSSAKSKMAPTKQFKISNPEGNGIFLTYNLEIDTKGVMKEDGSAKTYLFTQNGNSSFGSVIFHNTDIKCLAGQALTYITSNNRSIKDFRVENCRFNMDKGDSQQWILSLSSSTATYETITFRNNIFYCNEEGLTSNFKLFNGNQATINKIVIDNNSFINIATMAGTTASGLVYAANLTEADINRNIFFSRDGSKDYNYMAFRITNPIQRGTSADNIAYRNDGTTKKWQLFYTSGGNSCAWEGASELTTISDNPFEGGTFSPSTGEFVPNTTYSGLGATIE